MFLPRSFKVLALVGVLLPTVTLGVPAPDPAPNPAPAPVPAQYRIEDIVPVTTDAGEEDVIIYPNMKSDIRSSSPVLTANFEYFSSPGRPATLNAHWKREDIGKCIQWVAEGRCPIFKKNQQYNVATNDVMYATKISFGNTSIRDGNGNTWGKLVVFFSDRYCKKVIGIQQADATGVLERPALFSLQQADLRGDRGRASIYLQTIRLPPMFYTAIMP
ncbi:hypothetical protein H072_10605 [Dactylellina haptotyla CBS 200.50]|uniref:Ecp2 effector protein domain-containing protein n=1 Tax=Dactylellina haptotyla (strain CBS 200.50) TaxID=1284197 RepID=S7ZZ04_DACHA|nr:hypothetical protein H072_10605 [Dactylellina haptotyla CBS 200.50]